MVWNLLVCIITANMSKMCHMTVGGIIRINQELVIHHIQFQVWYCLKRFHAGWHCIRLPWTTQYLAHFYKLFYNCILLQCSLFWCTFLQYIDCSAVHLNTLHISMLTLYSITFCHTTGRYSKLVSLQYTWLHCILLYCTSLQCI